MENRIFLRLWLFFCDHRGVDVALHSLDTKQKKKAESVEWILIHVNRKCFIHSAFLWVNALHHFAVCL